MQVERLTLDGDPRELVARIRALIPAPASVTADVAPIVADVAARGDAAVGEYSQRFDGAPPGRVTPDELAAALEELQPAVRAAFEKAIANVAEVASAGADTQAPVALPEGHTVVLRDVPVRRAAVYVPGGAAPYPSSVVMGVVTARAAGVEEVVVCTPPPAAPVLLAACALCGVQEVRAIGGAQAIAALAYGTESIAPVDVIVGPGNLYVQEAKRLVADRTGIDGFAGPSDLLVLFDAADTGSLRLIALDMLAQGEHGAASIVVAVAADAQLLDELNNELGQLAAHRPTAQPGACVLVQAPSLDAALQFSDAFAPEHLELIGPQAELLAPRVQSAGCVFVGWPSATAFGDYVAGSNHVLPTAGAARFASGLSARHFRRRMAEVRIDPQAAAALAAAGAALARSEGFVVHAESMTARVPTVSDNPEQQ